MVSGGRAAAEVMWSGLGLRRGQSRIVAHDDSWPAVYRNVEADLAEALRDHVPKIEHIGSTAVPGLAAKPILDVAVALRSGFDTADVIDRLERMGLEFTGDAGDAGGLLFAATSGPDVVVLHVHVVAATDIQWPRYLAFRDALRRQPELAAEYTSLKRSLADRHPSDRVAYTDGKSAWIEAVLRSIEQGPIRID